MRIASIGTYRPVWQRGQSRIAGPDEDVVTLAVAAGKGSLQGADGKVTRLVLVTSSPDVLEGVGLGVVLKALDLPPSVPAELRIGGAPAAIDALVDSSEGTLVIGVDSDERSASAGAALVADTGAGAELTLAARSTSSLPMRVRRVGSDHADVYLDPRVERELASVPLLDLLSGEAETYVAGLTPKAAQKLGSAKSTVTATGASAPLLMLAELADQVARFRLVGLDAATGIGVDVEFDGTLAVHNEVRPPVPAERRPVDSAPDTAIPFSMPAYARAFEAKIGMVAAQCACGEVSFPPRLVCLACDRYEETTPVALPRTGEVYTAVTVHVPIPGIAGKYTLSIVSLDESPVRVLARVADVEEGDVPIGKRGRLVLRRIAVREGIPDYGYAFQLETSEDFA